ncbi:MAG: acetyl-CoA hydrolase/transferase C-terminal domain-containing protein [Gammaproteobacteria bacterium]
MHLETIEKTDDILVPGGCAFLHGTATEPRALVEYWCNSPESLSGVRLLTSFIPGLNTVNLAGLAPDQHVETFMNQREYAVSEQSKQLTALRYSYSRVRQHLCELARLDVAFVQLAPLKNGRYSTGITGGLIPTAIEKAHTVCGIVNNQMPVPKRSYTIAANRVDYTINVSRPLIEFGAATGEVNDVARKVAANVCSLINDGDTLQAGIGTIPTALFRMLEERRNLRVFSGMVSDSFAQLTASRSLDKRAEHVFGMALGSQKFYQWLNERDGFRVAGVEETHSRERISNIDKFVAVNSALSVGLDGIVNAEKIGSYAVSGPGGLPDFAAGATGSDGGRSIIALASTNSKGTVSRITPSIDDFAAKTVPADHVTHVVTEHGIADLRNVAADERASRLLAIADPAFRSDLKKAFEPE